MIFTVKLHPEVVKFLDETGTKFYYTEGEVGYQVNRTLYKSTNEDGLYTVSFIDLSYAEE